MQVEGEENEDELVEGEDGSGEDSEKVAEEDGEAEEGGSGAAAAAGGPVGEAEEDVNIRALIQAGQVREFILNLGGTIQKQSGRLHGRTSKHFIAQALHTSAFHTCRRSRHTMLGLLR